MTPENVCSEADKLTAMSHGISIVEAKQQLGFNNPMDWLYFPPEHFRSDIVVGLGERLGNIAQVLKKRNQCKNIYVASDFDVQHLEFNGFFEEIAALNESERRHKRNVGLCQTADVAFAIGPKMSGKLSAALCYDRKQVSNFTPGLISNFCEISNENRAVNDGEKFRVLALEGSQNGLEIAAKAVAGLNDKSYHLFYVTAAEKEEQKQLVKKFSQYHIDNSQLTIRSLPEREEDLKRLFCEVDLAIMPSSEQGFGMVALAALSSGLPIQVHRYSGFGEALKHVTGGLSSTVDSDHEDAKVWAKKIKEVREKPRLTRLQEAEILRSCYDEKYSWEKQCGVLVKMMVNMVSAKAEKTQ